MEEDLITVLAVDDELLICQELELFAWEEHGYRLLGTAKSAREALRMCREEEPDIVMTDITMPAMDGLALIRELGSRYPSMKMLILTCHEDFSYVKEAISLGAVDYILKLDLLEEPMIEALQKAGRLVAEERNRKRKKDNEIRERIAGKLLHRKNQEEMWPDEIRDMLEELHFPIRYFQSNSFLMIENRMESWVFVCVVLQEIFQMQKIVDNWFVFDDNCYAISSGQEGRAWVKQFIDYLNQVVEERFAFMKPHFHFYVVKARPVRDLKEYCDAIRRIESWKNSHFYDPDGIYIEEEDIPDDRAVTDEDFIRLERLGDDEAGPSLKKLFFGIPPSRLKEMLLRLMQKKNIDNRPFYEEILAAENIYRLEAIYKRIFCENDDQKYRYEIRKALKLIRSEYAKNLSLAGVAEYVQLSPQYLSRLFGETVGRSFNDYITDVRMENARRLIIESNYRVYQVAEMVGIPNYRYFSTVFKKYYGISPREMAAGKLREDDEG